MRYISKSLEETREVARGFFNILKKNYRHGNSSLLVALEGDLGSGKTTFVQSIGEMLGITENMHSPTFVIMKVYGIVQGPEELLGELRHFRNLIHVDAYRLENESELLHLGWREIITEPENLIFIEWPERVAGIIPNSASRISFKFTSESVREIDIL
jgi:tRNA threonylcarbamoyladenosine biosynthesis protein TsaE